MSPDAAARRRARITWPIRRVALDADEPDTIDGRTPSELVAMVHELTQNAWAMTGEPLPDYTREDAPGRVIRPPR